MARPSDPDVEPASQRLLRRIADHVQRRTEYRNARNGTTGPETTAPQPIPPDPTDPAATAA